MAYLNPSKNTKDFKQWLIALETGHIGRQSGNRDLNMKMDRQGNMSWGDCRPGIGSGFDKKAEQTRDDFIKGRENSRSYYYWLVKDEKKDNTIDNVYLPEEIDSEERLDYIIEAII